MEHWSPKALLALGCCSPANGQNVKSKSDLLSKSNKIWILHITQLSIKILSHLNMCGDFIARRPESPLTPLQLMAPSSHCGKSRLSSTGKDISYTCHHILTPWKSSISNRKLHPMRVRRRYCRSFPPWAPEQTLFPVNGCTRLNKSARRHDYFCVYSHCLYLLLCVFLIYLQFLFFTYFYP